MHVTPRYALSAVHTTMLFSPFEQFRERFISNYDQLEIPVSYGDLQALSALDAVIVRLTNVCERGYVPALQFTAWYIILQCWVPLLDVITSLLPSEPKSMVRFTIVFGFVREQFRSIVDSLWILIGANRRRKVAPFFFSTFFGSGAMNILGMPPYSWSITSQLVVTPCSAFVVWYSIVVEGLNHFGIQFFGLICPMTLPRPLVPLLIVIELISYVFRMVSLALRLFANIVAGHVLSELFGLAGHHVVSGSAGVMYYSAFIILTMRLSLSIPILFELPASILQAYIFTVLCMIYMRDVYFFQGIFE